MVLKKIQSTAISPAERQPPSALAQLLSNSPEFVLMYFSRVVCILIIDRRHPYQVRICGYNTYDTNYTVIYATAIAPGCLTLN